MYFYEQPIFLRKVNVDQVGMVYCWPYFKGWFKSKAI